MPPFSLKQNHQVVVLFRSGVSTQKVATLLGICHFILHFFQEHTFEKRFDGGIEKQRRGCPRVLKD